MRKVTPAAFATFTTISRKMTLDDFRTRYAYVKILHQTRNSTIRLASHVSTGQNIIVKSILKSNLNSQKKLTALFREIQTLYLLKDSKHVIKLYDVVDIGDSFYMIMEYADNGDLLNYIQTSQNNTEGTNKVIFRSIVKTVADLHGKNLVHRDLKLENIFMDTNLRVMIGDFGFAKTYKNTDDLCTSICGTAHYQPPEIIKGDSYDPIKADSWSLGVIFYILLFKKLPFSCPSITETLQLILSQDIKFPDNNYSEEALDLLSSLLCKDFQLRITPTEAMNHPYLYKKKRKYSNIRSKKEILHEQALSTILCPRDEFSKLSPDELVSYEIIKRRYQLLPKKGQQSPGCMGSTGSSYSTGGISTINKRTSDSMPPLFTNEQTRSVVRKDKLMRVSQNEYSPRKSHSDFKLKPTFIDSDGNLISETPYQMQQQQKQKQQQFDRQANSLSIGNNQQNLPMASQQKQVTIATPINIFGQQKQPAFLRNETYPINPLQNLLLSSSQQPTKLEHTQAMPRVLRNHAYMIRSTPNSAPDRKYDLNSIKHTPLNRPLSPIAEQQSKFANCNHITKEDPSQIMQRIINITQANPAVMLVSREELSAFIRFNDLYSCVSCGQISDELNGYMISKIKGEDSSMRQFEQILTAHLGNIASLDVQTLQNQFGINKVNVVVVLGNALPQTVEFSANIFKKELCDYILVSGAIGHSTPYLRDTIKSIPRFSKILVEGLSESQIFFALLTECFSVPTKNVIIENKSTNCGSNASETIKILDEKGINRDSILIIQDPTMQLRSWATFVHRNDEKTKKIISFAPFVPQIDENLKWEVGFEGLWELNRFIELILGEIPRLFDDENGYGPKGKNFICHVDVPDDVLEAYNQLKLTFTDFNNRIF